MLILLDTAHWCSTFTGSGHVKQKLPYFLNIWNISRIWRHLERSSTENNDNGVAHKPNSHHVVLNASLNFTFIARSMLGGWVILMLAKRRTTLQTLLVASSWQRYICPLVPSGGDKCFIYSFSENIGKCASALKFPVVRGSEVSVSGLQHQIMLNFLLPCQSLHVLRCAVLAAVRCVYEQTLQAYSPVCPGKVPREHIHLAHMLAPHWLFGLLCLQTGPDYKISFFSYSSLA